MQKDPSMDRIIALLRLTTSSNDHEALSAIRKANELLTKATLTWDDFGLAKKYQKQDEREDDENRPRTGQSKEVEEMFDFLMNNAPDWFDASFVESLHQQYEQKGSLSPKQFIALRKIYNMGQDKF